MVVNVGFGKVPAKSPPAAPVGARPEAQIKEPEPLVDRTWPPVPSMVGRIQVIEAGKVSGARRLKP